MGKRRSQEQRKEEQREQQGSEERRSKRRDAAVGQERALPRALPADFPRRCRFDEVIEDALCLIYSWDDCCGDSDLYGAFDLF